MFSVRIQRSFQQFLFVASSMSICLLNSCVTTEQKLTSLFSPLIVVSDPSTPGRVTNATPVEELEAAGASTKTSNSSPVESTK